MGEIETLTARQACEVFRENGLRMSPETLREGIYQKAFEPSFGYCIKNGNGKVLQCTVFKNRLDRFFDENGRN